MAAMENYFSFGCRTMCGIPSITLTGTLEDWQRSHRGGGSGSHSFISGWISILYPYLANGQANILRPWAEMFFHGPESSDFPATISSVPCDWEYFGTQYDLHFHAGIIGFTQDSDTGSLESVLGWLSS
ncbi:hypothetical protein EMIHUDRAFT_251675 [Emiliania huxleyi CCMP1516]|uniref:Glycosyl hydrolase family 92 domain-containing protein n=2 Tax=Emiliania huxleyi TaxID=2903 RepID=A0A0D3KSI0_EMIH1|nr:hypothetical protein EMIHUDRAFT_251675 [Emiliania huxleyi CCMP1516]EOD38715.1 hypothetical protein EMIHUDRAFT_251675 [Emiliania huxleyi CCMP1516]|eukprot:XP_005791144.1 hypothetical protein EMIHUDRAFT_251675 [Emiliania huxleyi CCMP1516]